MAAFSPRMSTTTISLPRPFILTNGWLASALMGKPGLPPYMGKPSVLGRPCTSRDIIETIAFPAFLVRDCPRAFSHVYWTHIGPERESSSGRLEEGHSP